MFKALYLIKIILQGNKVSHILTVLTSSVSSLPDPGHFGTDPNLDPDSALFVSEGYSYYFCLMMEGSDPDPYHWITDPDLDPGDSKTYGSGSGTMAETQYRSKQKKALTISENLCILIKMIPCCFLWFVYSTAGQLARSPSLKHVWSVQVVLPV